MASQNTSPVWFITGCSTGFGRELAKLIIARGWPVVVTARNKAQVEDLATSDKVLALELDVTDSKEIDAAVKAAEEKFGGIDVLVNNAGYGYLTTVEEGEEKEIRAMFDANVFGLFALTRAVLPGMRKRRKGTSSTSPRSAATSAIRARAIMRRPSTRWRAGRNRWPRRPHRSASR